MGPQKLFTKFDRCEDSGDQEGRPCSPEADPDQWWELGYMREEVPPVGPTGSSLEEENRIIQWELFNSFTDSARGTPSPALDDDDDVREEDREEKDWLDISEHSSKPLDQLLRFDAMMPNLAVPSTLTGSSGWPLFSHLCDIGEGRTRKSASRKRYPRPKKKNIDTNLLHGRKQNSSRPLRQSAVNRTSPGQPDRDSTGTRSAVNRTEPRASSWSALVKRTEPGKLGRAESVLAVKKTGLGQVGRASSWSAVNRTEPVQLRRVQSSPAMDSSREPGGQPASACISSGPATAAISNRTTVIRRRLPRILDRQPRFIQHDGQTCAGEEGAASTGDDSCSPQVKFRFRLRVPVVQKKREEKRRLITVTLPGSARRSRPRIEISGDTRAERDVHNSNERQRRIHLAEAFRQLGLLLPEIRNSPVLDKSSTSKIRILEGAIRLCTSLTFKDQALMSVKEALQQDRLQLEDRLARIMGAQESV